MLLVKSADTIIVQWEIAERGIVTEEFVPIIADQAEVFGGRLFRYFSE